MSGGTGLEGLEGLPAWLQGLISMGFLVGAAATAIVGYTKKRLGTKTAEQKSQDTVVISAAFADSRVMQRLEDAIQSLRDCEERQTDAVNRQSDAINRLNDTIRTLADKIRDMPK